MAFSTGDTLEWDMEAPGGSSFLEHGGTLGPQLAKKKIKEGGWDYVSLQEQSLTPAVPDTNIYIMFKYGARLDSHINLDNPCAETVFYMTWGRKNGDSFLCAKYIPQFNWPHYCTYNSMDSMIRLRYEQIANDNQAIISPAGAVWRYIRVHHPSIELYNTDESHPSEAGSYAVACAFHTTFFRKDPSSISFDYNLSSSDAAIIRSVTKKVVYDSMSYWHIGEHKTNSLFEYNVTGTTVSYKNKSTNTTNHMWHFGDGQTDTSTTPIHTYAQKGIYTVTQIATNQTTGCSDTSYAHINLFPADIDEIYGKSEFHIYPNPNTGALIIESPRLIEVEEIIIKDITGKQMVRKTVNADKQLKLTLNDIQDGTYILELYNHNNVYRERIVISR